MSDFVLIDRIEFPPTRRAGRRILLAYRGRRRLWWRCGSPGTGGGMLLLHDGSRGRVLDRGPRLSNKLVRQHHDAIDKFFDVLVSHRLDVYATMQIAPAPRRHPVL